MSYKQPSGKDEPKLNTSFCLFPHYHVNGRKGPNIKMKTDEELKKKKIITGIHP